MPLIGTRSTAEIQHSPRVASDDGLRHRPLCLQDPQTRQKFRSRQMIFGSNTRPEWPSIWASRPAWRENRVRRCCRTRLGCERRPCMIVKVKLTNRAKNERHLEIRTGTKPCLAQRNALTSRLDAPSTCRLKKNRVAGLHHAVWTGQSIRDYSIVAASLRWRPGWSCCCLQPS